MSLPKGLVIAYHMKTGDPIPDGWALCDGNNATPDLSGRFILGSTPPNSTPLHNVGDTGGKETHTLTIDEMPSHTHTFNDKIRSTFGNYVNEGGNPAAQATEETEPNTTAATGGGNAFSIMPPYYTLTYLIKI